MKNKVIDYLSLNEAREIYFPEKSKSWVKMQIYQNKIPPGVLKYFGNTAFLKVDYLNSRFHRDYKIPLAEDEKGVSLDDFYSHSEVRAEFSPTTNATAIVRNNHLEPSNLINADGNSGISKDYLFSTYYTIPEQIQQQIAVLDEYTEEEKSILYMGATLSPSELIEKAQNYLQDNNARALFLLLKGLATEWRLGLVYRDAKN